MKLNSFKPKLSGWFSLGVEYEGSGVATFKNPEGTLTGPVRVQLDASRRLKAEMVVEGLTMSASSPQLKPIEFLREGITQNYRV